MTCDEVQHLLSFYVTGALDDAQSVMVRDHLSSSCPVCLEALAETYAAFELFTGLLNPMEPPPQIKQKLMDAVGKRHATRPPHRPASILPYALAACIGLLIGAVGVYLLANHAGGAARDHTEQLRAAVADRDAQIEQLDQLLGANNLDLVELADKKSHAHGHILYDPAHHDWRLYVFNLEPPPLNHVYELWAITADSRKLPAGTFTVDANGTAVYSGHTPDDVAAAAITDEPSGGSSSPTGAIHLLGKING